MEELVRQLVTAGTLRSSSIVAAFRAVDRKWFVRPEDAGAAYGDYALPIGYGQTISQPTTVAFMLELLGAARGERVLDVGSGSGWTTALLARIVGRTGKVWGVEVVPELVAFGRKNLQRTGVTNAIIRRASAGIGLPAFAPYERILVSAAAEELPPPLVEQLKPGGVMVLPVGSAVWRVRKDAASRLAVEPFEGFAFVPFVGAPPSWSLRGS